MLLGEIGKPRQPGKVAGSRGMGKLSEEARPVIGQSNVEGNRMYYCVGQRFRVGGTYWVPRLAALAAAILIGASPSSAMGSEQDDANDRCKVWGGGEICIDWTQVGCHQIEMGAEYAGVSFNPANVRFAWKIFPGECNPSCSSWLVRFGQNELLPGVSAAQYYTHTYGSAGTYKVEVVYYDVTAIAKTLEWHSFWIDVKPKPTTNFPLPTQEDDSLVVTFEADAPHTDGLYEYRWSFGYHDESGYEVFDVSTEREMVHEYPEPGNYIVTVEVTEYFDEEYFCVSSFSRNIGVRWPDSGPTDDEDIPLEPTAQFTWSPENPRIGEPITFTPLGANAPWADDFYFYWQFDSSAPPRTGIATTLTRTPEQLGPFNISLTLLDKRTWRTMAGPVHRSIVVSPGLRVVATLDAPDDVDPGTRAWGLEIDKNTNTAWVGARGSIVGVDISDPTRPSVVGRVEMPSSTVDVSNFVLRDGLMAVGSSTVRLFNVRNPSNPVLLTTYNAYTALGVFRNGLGLFDDYLYLTSTKGIYVFDVSAQRAGEAAQLGQPISLVNNVKAESNVHFAAIGTQKTGFIGHRNSFASTAGFTVLNMDDPVNPSASAFVETSGNPQEFVLKDGGDHGLLCMALLDGDIWVAYGGGFACYSLRPSAGSLQVQEIASLGRSPATMTSYKPTSISLRDGQLFSTSNGVVFEFEIPDAIGGGEIQQFGFANGAVGALGNRVVRHVPIEMGRYLVTKWHDGHGGLLAVFAY